MTMTPCDVAIVGGGVTGLSTAVHLALAQAGRVRLLERHYLGAGQSGRAAGIIRSTVRHLGLAHWQAESARFFLELEERFGEPLTVHQTGYLLLSDVSQQECVDVAVRTANAAGCKTERITRQDACELQPGLRADDRTIYAFEAGAVHLDPMVATQALARVARSLGVEIVEACAVTDIEPAGQRVRLTTSAGCIHTGAVLIATSCWMPDLTKRFDAACPIRPHRAEMAFFHRPVKAPERLHRILSDASSGIYLRPEATDQMFVGWREGDWIHSLDDCVLQDPDLCRQTAEFATMQKLHAALSQTLPWMREGFTHRTFACTYDYSPDGMPILDRLECAAGIYFAAGFSGGGFSLSPFIGRTMAEYIRTGVRPADIAELSERRFEEGRLIQWSNASAAVRK